MIIKLSCERGNVYDVYEGGFVLSM